MSLDEFSSCGKFCLERARTTGVFLELKARLSAAAVSLPSAGLKTIMPGIDLSIAKCSIGS